MNPNTFIEKEVILLNYGFEKIETPWQKLRVRSDK